MGKAKHFLAERSHPITGSVWATVKKVVALLDKRERLRGLLLLGMVLVMALLETSSVASIIPFVALLTHPGVIESNRYLAFVYQWLEFRDVNSFLLFLGFVVFAVVIGSTAFKALTVWAQLRFVSMRQYTLSRRLFKAYMQRPYEWFLAQHSADLGKSVLSEVQQVVTGALIPALQLVTQSALTALIIALLMLVSPILALTLTIVLGGAYSAILWAGRRYLNRIGRERIRANRERFRICNEALSGIKDIKVLGLENAFMGRFQDPSMRFMRHQAAAQIINQLPQFAIQSVAVTGVLLIILYQLGAGGSNYETLALLALYAVAGYRIMPALQRIYQAIAQIRFSAPAVEALHRDLLQANESWTAKKQNAQPPVRLLQALEFRRVSYRYPSASGFALKGVSLTIPARSTLGIVGRTGAGKSTAVDLLLGLLAPSKGTLYVDDLPLDRSNIRAWQRNVGYVPQNIFIADDDMAANIAFGIDKEAIDMAAVEHAARIANLHDFVTGELELGYRTMLGERGARLSGGQRQRVGIARALYRDPDIIIMDEATSALDNITEKAVMDAVANLHNRKTIVLVAHRLTTVQRCDLIFVLDKGCLVASGTYQELVEESEHFQAMVNTVELTQ
jgi:ABC-type bacteriocin/lantibiotic exporter with double-glycine peptidase domain